MSIIYVYVLNYLLAALMYFEIQSLGVSLIEVLPTKLGMKERANINKKLKDLRFKKKMFILWPGLIAKDIYEKNKEKK
jgi:hypothetical protein